MLWATEEPFHLSPDIAEVDQERKLREAAEETISKPQDDLQRETDSARPTGTGGPGFMIDEVRARHQFPNGWSWKADPVFSGLNLDVTEGGADGVGRGGADGVAGAVLQTSGARRLPSVRQRAPRDPSRRQARWGRIPGQAAVWAARLFSFLDHMLAVSRLTAGLALKGIKAAHQSHSLAGRLRQLGKRF